MNFREATMAALDVIEGMGSVRTHRCPECGDTYRCWDADCAAPESALCPDCDRGRGRERALPCGHLPGGCVRFEWRGQLVCSVAVTA